MRRPPNLTPASPTSRAMPAPASADHDRAPTNYLDLYGLSKPPFGGTPDTGGYILFGSHRRTFELIVDHMVNGTGLLLVLGEEGIGKTETLRAASAVAGKSGLQTFMVSRTAGERTNLPQLVSALSGHLTKDEAKAQEAIELFLHPPRKAILIDDVDLMPDDCIQLLWSLMQRMPNVSGGSVIILGSSTDLVADTKRPELSQVVGLARNTVRLSRLGPAEIRQYIERSLWIAGGTTRRLITNDAMKIIIARSGGVPGVVNRLMEAAFTAGFARGDATITAKTVAAATGSMAPKPARKEHKHSHVFERVAQIVAVGLLVTGVSVFVYQGLNDRPDNASTTSPIPSQAPTPRQPSSAPPAPQPQTVQPVDQPPVVKPTESLSPRRFRPP